MLRLALPSKGDMGEPTLDFLQSCGLSVSRSNLRQYRAEIPYLPGVNVIFQRAADIPDKVEEGSADLGISGLNNVTESLRQDPENVVVMDNLGYSRCELVLSVPVTWIDVSSIADLVDLSVELREQGRELRIATQYPRLTQSFLFRKGLNYFTLVESSGATEAAPAMGYADIIADISSSGATLRENQLKTIAGGTILKSQACLIANRRALKEDREKLALTRSLVELIEAHMRAGGFYRLTANVCGSSAEAIAALVMQRPEVSGIQGPTIARVFDKDGESGSWYAVTLVVPKAHLLAAMEHLRFIGASSITAFGADYVFGRESDHYRRLLAALDMGEGEGQ